MDANFGEPRKSKAQRRMDGLTERQRKLEADIITAQLELKQENEREKERQGAAAFVACVRRMDRGHLDPLRANVLTVQGTDEAQLNLIRDWFDNLVNLPPPQGETRRLDAPGVSATAVPLDDDTARQAPETAASDSTDLPKTRPPQSQILPTEKSSTDSVEDAHRADTNPTSRTLPEPADGHQGHLSSAAVDSKPVISPDGAVESQDRIQAADETGPGGVPSSGASSDTSAHEGLKTPRGEGQPSSTPPEELPVISQEIKDRQWHGDYLIEVWQKGGCQVIGMETAFNSPEEATEHLTWLETSAGSGDEKAKRALATAAQATTKYEPKPPRTTGA